MTDQSLDDLVRALPTPNRDTMQICGVIVEVRLSEFVALGRIQILASEEPGVDYIAVSRRSYALDHLTVAVQQAILARNALEGNRHRVTLDCDID